MDLFDERKKMKDNQHLGESMKTKILSTKVTISTMVGVAVIITIMYLAYSSHRQFEDTVVAQTEQQMLSTVRSTAHGLEDFIHSIQRELRNGARNPQIQNAAEKSILESEVHEKGYHPFKAIFDGFDAKINAFYLLDANGIVLDRVPFKKERIGVSYLHKPGVEDVLSEHKPYVSEMFKTTSGLPAVSILQPILKDNESVGMMRAIIHIETFNKHFMQPIKIGKEGYLILLDDDGTIYHHPAHELIGKQLRSLQENKLGGVEEKEREAVKDILSGSEGRGHLVFDPSLPYPQCIAWTYVSTSPITSGVAGIKISYDSDVPRDKLEKEARIIASELDRAIPKRENLANTKHLQKILEDLQAKYPDIVEITIHVPRSAQDRTLVCKVSTSPGLEGRLSDPEDVQAVKDDTYNVQFVKQKQGRPRAGEDVIDLTVPIHTGEKIWPLVAVQPYSEITGPINRHVWNTSGLAGLVILLFGAAGVLLFRAEKRKADLRAERRHLQQIAESTEALRESEERFRGLFEQSNDAVIIHESGKIIDVNQRTCEILGYSKEQLLTMSIPDLHPEKDRPQSRNRIDTARRGEAILFETQWRKADGTMVDVEVSSRIVDHKNRIVQGITRDISERKQAEEEKWKLEAQLGQAQKMEALGTLAGGIAHNFNNLLMSIQGNASLMLLEADSAHPNYERLKNIEKSVQSGSKLTRQVLGYAREGKYEIKPISLNQVVEETSDTFGATRKGIAVHRELAQDLLGVKADQGQIEQVLLNLYVNAADAMPGGGDLFLKTTNVTNKDIKNKPYKAKPGGYVFLTVKDTGTGMDKKTLDRIFDPFFTTKGLARGTGLGLASVYGIVKAHGGYIGAESKKGHGTTFSIYLPASEEKVRKPVDSAERIIEGTGTILLVDDEEMVLDVGVQLLKVLGYTVLEAKGAREAVEIYQKNKDDIDLVILDMIMPGVGGGETYDRMKDISPDIKVLLSSGYTINGQATEILKRGCDGFIQKPFNMKQLSQAIRKILDKKQS